MYEKLCWAQYLSTRISNHLQLAQAEVVLAANPCWVRTSTLLREWLHPAAHPATCVPPHTGAGWYSSAAVGPCHPSSPIYSVGLRAGQPGRLGATASSLLLPPPSHASPSWVSVVRGSLPQTTASCNNSWLYSTIWVMHSRWTESVVFSHISGWQLIKLSWSLPAPKKNSKRRSRVTPPSAPPVTLTSWPYCHRHCGGKFCCFWCSDHQCTSRGKRAAADPSATDPCAANPSSANIHNNKTTLTWAKITIGKEDKEEAQRGGAAAGLGGGGWTSPLTSNLHQQHRQQLKLYEQHQDNPSYVCF